MLVADEDTYRMAILSYLQRLVIQLRYILHVSIELSCLQYVNIDLRRVC
jgi:hypothetical protein